MKEVCWNRFPSPLINSATLKEYRVSWTDICARNFILSPHMHLWFNYTVSHSQKDRLGDRYAYKLFAIVNMKHNRLLKIYSQTIVCRWKKYWKSGASNQRRHVELQEYKKASILQIFRYKCPKTNQLSRDLMTVSRDKSVVLVRLIKKKNLFIKKFLSETNALFQLKFFFCKKKYAQVERYQ